MAEYKVQLPDKSYITVEGPDDATDEELINTAKQHWDTRKPANITTTVEKGIEAVKSADPFNYVLGTAATGLGLYGASKLKDKFFGSKEAPPRIEPRMDVSTAGPKEPVFDLEKPAAPASTPAPKTWEETLSTADRELLERSKANAPVREEYMRQITPGATAEPPNFLLKEPAVPVVPPTAAPAPVAPTAVSPVETAPVVTTSAATPAPAAQAAPQIEEKLGKPTATTGTGMPAYHGEGTEKSKIKSNFNSIKEVPQGYVFVPGGNYMDAVRNAVGQEAYTANLKSTGGYPTSNEAQIAQSREINRSLGRPTREEALAKGLPLGEKTPPITQKVAGKKLVHVGGVAGALILATDLAKAAQERDVGKMADIATDFFVPPFAQSLGLNANEEQELARRRYEGMVGAGRGIAPPSAYQR